MDEEFQRYLRSLGRLYVEAVTADVHSDLLRRMGGVLALAGRDSNWIRVEQDAALGFVDMRRSLAEIERIARARWRQHRQSIEGAIANGIPPARAVERHFRSRTGTYAHSPQQLERMLQQHVGQAGTYSAWFYEIADSRRRLQRAGDVLAGSTFTGIAAGAYFIATAEDWEHGTPREWDRAFEAGESVAPIAGLAEAVAGVQQARTAPHPPSTSTGPRVVVVDRGAGGPSSRGTGTQARGTGAANRGTLPRGQRAAPTRSTQRSAGSVADDLNVDEAFREGAPFQRGAMWVSTGREDG
jgi:hypothetical protein